MSFISEPTPFAAEIVVSDIIERLSPKYAPPITAAHVKGRFNPAACATPIAIGAIAATVPIDVPIAVEIKHDIRNTPGTRAALGINVSPRLTTDSTPPIDFAAPWNPPAKR